MCEAEMYRDTTNEKTDYVRVGIMFSVWYGQDEKWKILEWGDGFNSNRFKVVCTPNEGEVVPY